MPPVCVLLWPQIRTAMVTGDHVRTAISVAHQCQILPVGRPVLLVDGPAAAGQPSSSASLSVLYPDGSVNNRVTRSTVLAQVRVPARFWLHTECASCAAVGSGCCRMLSSLPNTQLCWDTTTVIVVPPNFLSLPSCQLASTQFSRFSRVKRWPFL
jgi:hypothetical protein